MKLAKEGGQQNSLPKGRLRRLRCPTLPTLVLENLKGLVKNLDEEFAEPIADLVGCYHSQHARLAGVEMACASRQRRNAGRRVVAESRSE